MENKFTGSAICYECSAPTTIWATLNRRGLPACEQHFAKIQQWVVKFDTTNAR